MSDEPTRFRPASRVAPVVIVVGACVVLATYAAAYLGLRDRIPVSTGEVDRVFTAQWQAEAFAPAAATEAQLKKAPVSLHVREKGYTWRFSP